MAEKRTIVIEVTRYDPDRDGGTYVQSWPIEFTDDMSVLQGLQQI